eukprot:CFRG1263T1
MHKMLGSRVARIPQRIPTTWIATAPVHRPLTTTTEEKREITMPFKEYREIKKTMKTRGRIVGVPAGFGSMFGTSFAILSTNPTIMDPPANLNDIQLILGMDPMLATVLATTVAGGVGYVFGGTFYSFVWRLINREKANQLILRDADFMKRLDKHRFVDDQKQEDDYYGEKVLTVADYRNWLKDQKKKGNKKLTDFTWHKKPAFM